MSNHEVLPSEGAVFERTPAGQSEVLLRRLPLTPIEQRILLMVTGHTPLSQLLMMAGQAQTDVHLVDGLIHAGLIRVSDTPTQPLANMRRDKRSRNPDFFNIPDRNGLMQQSFSNP